MLENYKDIIDKVSFSDEPNNDTSFVQAVADSSNKGIENSNKTKYNSIFSQTRNKMKHAKSASIEALYIILGFPDVELRKKPLSLDK